MTQIECVAPVQAILGEGPIWNAEEESLYWIDAWQPLILRYRPADARVDTWKLPEALNYQPIGSLVFRQGGGLVVAMKSGFHFLDLETGHHALVADPESNRPPIPKTNRLSDGKCDRRGRYWCGSTNSNLKDPTGSLYRLDADGTCTTMAEGTIVSNGIAWSPDDRTMYYADSRALTVWAYDFDLESGSLSHRRVFISTRGLSGRVDGATVDSDGNYWAALIGMGAIGCFGPSGLLERIITLPVKNPAMCTFGGRNLDELYVVTSTRFTPDHLRRKQPLAGGLFCIRGLGARGLPEPRFAG
jgi:sugar lactone lactonase YvrE